MHLVGVHIVEQALVMRDQQHGLIGLAHDRIDPLTHRAQRIDVEAGIRLVEDRQLGVEDAHLHHLGALLFAARKADVHIALQHLHVELQEARLFLGELQKFAARQRLFAPRLALRIQRLAQELHIGNAGNFDRILEAEEQTGSGTFMRLKLQHVLAVERHRTLGHFVTRTAAQHIGKRRLARAIGAHDCVDLTRADFQRQPVEDLLAIYLGVEVFNLQHQSSLGPSR
jgi:hypothetical protein